jgi:hypothetical protein
MTPVEFLQKLVAEGIPLDPSSTFAEIDAAMRGFAKGILDHQANSVLRKQWIDWDGSEVGPLANTFLDDCQIKVMFADGTTSNPAPHNYWSWEASNDAADIVAYWIM